MVQVDSIKQPVMRDSHQELNSQLLSSAEMTGMLMNLTSDHEAAVRHIRRPSTGRTVREKNARNQECATRAQLGSSPTARSKGALRSSDVHPLDRTTSGWRNTAVKKFRRTQSDETGLWMQMFLGKMRDKERGRRERAREGEQKMRWRQEGDKSQNISKQEKRNKSKK